VQMLLLWKLILKKSFNWRLPFGSTAAR